MRKAARALAHPAVRVMIESELARKVRQHSRSSMKAEVCGVLIGKEEGSLTIVEACIPGANAAQGGAHVTFTQDTWEHIYQVKDKEYPDARIVGWYHSHPGFGVFLSDHDLFIHQNFFSSPQQIAWVYDPHTDEEGCFGWHEGKILKIDDVAVRFGQPCGDAVAAVADEEMVVKVKNDSKDEKLDLWDAIRYAAICVMFFLGGAAGMFFYLDRTAIVMPRVGSALVIIQDNKAGLVPPEVTEHILAVMQQEMDAQKRVLQSIPPGQLPTPASGGATANPQGEQNGRQK
jgi:proteasome lid subunit RPN8/RPN11